MKLFRIALSLLFLSGAIHLNAQTADEIVDKHVAAIGGKETISKIKSMITESTISVMGIDLPTTTTILVGKGIKSVSLFETQQMKIVQCVTPSGGWMYNPIQGMTEAQKMPEEQVKALQPAYEIADELFDYRAKGHKVELTGRENVNGTNVYKLKITLHSGKVISFSIDPLTWYVLKTEAKETVNGNEFTTTTILSDYKKTDIGFVMAFTRKIDQGFESTILIKKVEFNKEIDPKIFKMPETWETVE